MFDYSVKFEAIDKISAKINKINEKMAGMGDKAKKASEKVSKSMDKSNKSTKTFANTLNKVSKRLDEVGNKGKKLAVKGVGALAGGAGMLLPLKEALGAYQDIARAKGEIASLGIDDKGIKSIAKSAMEFSDTWAGTTTADFIRASYDIKSGIASLSDVDVGKFTALAGMTATATKASVAEMTKLFALGHGIFREQFSSDVEFGEKFSSAISTAVQAFRTDGADLVSGLSTLGASATALGIKLEEQLAVLGMSKGAFNSASEGATSYRAFLMGAIKAQKKLGLSFTDSNGKILPMADILDKIRKKVKSAGMEMKDAKVQQALAEAFGSIEAVKMIGALIGKTDELRASQTKLAQNMMQGTKITKEMALAMQQGKEFELLQQKMQNLSATIGGYFAPMALKVADYIGRVTDKVRAWTEKNPGLTSTIVTIATVVGGLLATLGVLSIVAGVVGMAIGSLTGVLTVFKGVMKVAQIATLLFNTALWANPITWIIAGVIALVGAVVGLIVYWKEITEWVGKLWDKLAGFAKSNEFVQASIMGIGTAFDFILSPIQKAIDFIDKLLSKFEIYNNVKDTIAGAWDITKQALGFGDNQEPATQTIDNVNKNHTIVDVNVTATGGAITEQKAQSTGGRVKLNTANNGV